MQVSPRMASPKQGDVLISSFLTYTGGQGSEQWHFSSTVWQSSLKQAIICNYNNKSNGKQVKETVPAESELTSPCNNCLINTLHAGYFPFPSIFGAGFRFHPGSSWGCEPTLSVGLPTRAIPNFSHFYCLYFLSFFKKCIWSLSTLLFMSCLIFKYIYKVNYEDTLNFND